MRESNDLIPRGMLRLSRALGEIESAIVNRRMVLPKFDDESILLLRQSKEEEDQVEHDPAAYAELADEWHFGKVLNLFLRQQLEAGELAAYVRDPSGVVLQLGTDGWIPEEWWDSGYVPPAIWTDFIEEGSYEAPGPKGTYIRSALRPVFFDKREFANWLARFEPTASAKGRRGRTAGSGSYVKAEMDLLREMRRLVNSAQAKSVYDAANMVAPRAPGKGTPESIRDRIYRRFRKMEKTGLV